MGGVVEKILVSALTGVMSPLLGKLTNLIEKEYKEMKGVRKQLEQLRKELMAIDIALNKYAAMENQDTQMKGWIAEVRELAYDMEDSIDLFTYRVDHEPPGNTTTAVKRVIHKTLRKVKKFHHRHKFAKEIKELHVLVNEAYKRQKRYRIDKGASSKLHTEIDPRLPVLYVEVEKLVGIEGPSNEIIDWFIREDKEPTGLRKIVSIVGQGGSGKTTLAKQVYEKIKGQFSFSAFLTVSQTPNMNNLLRELLSQIKSNEPMESYSDQQVVDKLRAELKEKRYIVVIDDIWKKSEWETIQCALPKSACASRIITTTRIKSVAEFCCISNEDFVYQMKQLSKADSENLFLKRTFRAEDECPNHLKGIMTKILHKCDGLPLAIITLASLLADKPKIKEEWERVVNYMDSINEKDNSLEVMDKILSLSYNDLPHHLKNCLLYLSTFPEDHEIDKDILVWRWIAEGFITTKQGFTLEEVAESYFYELINRSLIQHIQIKPFGEGGCRVHDIVLNFLIFRSTEENFLTKLDGQDLPYSHSRIRRLLVWNKQENARAISQGTLDLSNLRSIDIRHDDGWMMSRLLNLPVLRVLNLEGCALCNSNLDCIVSLFHLRYLGLRRSRIGSLPVQIGKLECLQTLDLSDTPVLELPESIIQLKKLMRLVGNHLILPDGFGNMESLHELGVLCGYRSSINFVNFGKDLQLLRNLRVLRVRFFPEGTSNYHLETRKEALMSSLCKLGGNNLRALYISNHIGSGDCFADSWCPLPRFLQKFVCYSKHSFSTFPKWICPSLSSLTYLDFKVKRMEGGDLRILEDLPALIALYLQVDEVPRDGVMISHGAFQCLERLRFYNRNGPGLVLKGGMPKLEWLSLAFHGGRAQSTYGSLEVSIRQMSSLKYINLIVHVISGNENDIKNFNSVIYEQVRILPHRPEANIKFCSVEPPQQAQKST